MSKPRRKVNWKISHYREKATTENQYNELYPRYLSCLEFVQSRLEQEEDIGGFYTLSERKNYTSPFEIVIPRLRKLEFMKELKKLMKKVKE